MTRAKLTQLLKSALVYRVDVRKVYIVHPPDDDDAMVMDLTMVGGNRRQIETLASKWFADPDIGTVGDVIGELLPKEPSPGLGRDPAWWDTRKKLFDQPIRQ